MLLLNAFQDFRVEFEPKGFVFGVNESLPDPDWKDDIVPTLELHLFVVVINLPLQLLEGNYFVFNFAISENPLVGIVHFGLAILAFLLGQRVLYFFQSLIVLLQRSHQHLEVFLRDFVMGYVDRLDRLIGNEGRTDQVKSHLGD